MMKPLNTCFIGLVCIIFGLVMIVVNAVDYLVGSNQTPSAVGIIGLAMVLIGMGLSRKKCDTP